MKKIPLLFILLFTINCFAQLSKTHYIPPLTGSNNVTAQEHYFYISTPSITPVKVNINALGIGTTSIFVSQSSPFSVEIGNNFNSQLIVSPTLLNTKLSNKGYIIESESLIYVSVRVLAGGYNQAGSLVSKGLAALGKQFRVGAFTNSATTNSSPARYTFLSILATENNTKVDFSNIKSGVTFVNYESVAHNPPSITLDRGQSYLLAVEDNSVANKDGLIGALIKSDKPIAFNCGSFGGTNGDNNQNLDLGFDQIVPIENIKNPISNESEYIFVKGGNINILERPLIIAHENNTEVYINGSATPAKILSMGEYYAIDGSLYSANKNMYVKTSKPTFAYQSIGGTSQANQQLFFVPPLNCSTPKIVNNIPSIEKIGTRDFITNSGLNIVTGNNADVKLSINGVIYPISSLPPGINASTANSVTGNANFETYTITGLTGNIGVFSNKQVYVSFFGTNSAATYGGYYSGFDLKPEVIIDNSNSTIGSCIPNITLKTEFDQNYSYQWIKNNTDIIGEDKNVFIPTEPGYYKVKRSIPGCSTNTSIEIPVSNCPSDGDSDSVPDDVDLDFDNDGITNFKESFEDLDLDLTGTSIVKNSYSNTFSKTILPTAVNGSSVSVPLVEKNNGNFISEVPAGKGNSLEYKINFSTPISVALEYVTTGNPTDLINSEGEFIVKSDINKTITILNPNNQLLIDTNYDGVFESGITQYSSFEIRFRLNSTTPLAIGTGKFSFQSYLTSSLTFIHKNLSDISSNRATFKIKIKCIPRNSDSDLLPDYLDTDSDNDGILDIIESQTNTLVGPSTIDANKDGLYDVFGTGTIPINSDGDKFGGEDVDDYLDLDSDNDGIYDSIESGTNAANPDLDGDLIQNYRELDSDNDNCFDVIEAGFTDGNKDGRLGDTIPNVDPKGIVTNGIGYSAPNSDYYTSAPISITNLPNFSTVCNLQGTSITVIDNGGVTYQWQLSTNGITWNDLTNNAIYTGVTSKTLSINPVGSAMNGYLYRVQLNKAGNSCGLISNPTTLKVFELPVAKPNIKLIQCDNDGDGKSDFNLTEINKSLSNLFAVERFTYYFTQIGAATENASDLISNPISHNSISKTIWVRIENANDCYVVSDVELIVSSTQIPANFIKKFPKCDDSVDGISTDTDGTAEFDFSSVTAEVNSLLPPPLSNYSIKYYPSEADALAETNEITNTTNYRNISYPNQQDIWIRIESIFDNACYGLGPHIKLIVNPKPNIDLNENGEENKIVCSNLPDLFVELNPGINDGTPVSDYSFSWTKDNDFYSSEPILNVNQEGKYVVKVENTHGCSRMRTIQVTTSETAKIENIQIVDLAEKNSITINTSGKGTYEYSLDAPVGPFQRSNFFDDVSAGIHDIYIIDTKGCGTVKRTVAVVGVPKFFTPNSDGYNDYWNIKGINSIFGANSTIYIFDRFGKLIKQLIAGSIGWDGTMNGYPLPADDYWYTLLLEDGREVKGHFSLIR